MGIMPSETPSPFLIRCNPRPCCAYSQGEEGIDAGGVTREWYMVMAREVFNPNLALFVQVRGGGPGAGLCPALQALPPADRLTAR
jgi:hypothetical protein